MDPGVGHTIADVAECWDLLSGARLSRALAQGDGAVDRLIFKCTVLQFWCIGAIRSQA